MALDFNQQGRDTLTLRVLLKNGAKVHARSAYEGFKPLHNAAYFGLLEEFQLLIAYGAEIDAQDDGPEETPLMRAIRSSPATSSKTVVELRQLGASMNTKNIYGETSLECALKENLIKSEYQLDFLKVVLYNAMK